MPPLDGIPIIIAASQTQLIELPSEKGQRRLGTENTLLAQCNGIIVFPFDILFNEFDAVGGAMVVVGIHRLHCSQHRARHMPRVDC